LGICYSIIFWSWRHKRMLCSPFLDEVMRQGKKPT
jgi:hypothetical protein